MSQYALFGLGVPLSVPKLYFGLGVKGKFLGGPGTVTKLIRLIGLVTLNAALVTIN